MSNLEQQLEEFGAAALRVADERNEYKRRADAAEARVKVLEGLLKRSWPWLSAASEGIQTDPDPAFSAANLDAYMSEVRAALASKEEGGR